MRYYRRGIVTTAPSKPRGKLLTSSFIPSDVCRARGVWRFVRCFEDNLLTRGWKLHISCVFEERQRALDLVASLTLPDGIAFKYLVDDESYVDVHGKEADPSQLGKFITIYPKDPKQIEFLISSLLEHDFDGADILTDTRIANSNFLYARFGLHRSFQIPDEDGKPIESEYPASTPRTYRQIKDDVDTRDATQNIPEILSRMTDKMDLEWCESKQDRANVDRSDYTSLPNLLEKYAVTQLVLRNGSGGRYIGTDKATGARVFLKEARRCAGFELGAGYASDRLRKEYGNILTVESILDENCVSHARGLFKLWTSEFLVTSLVDGVSVHEWMAEACPLAAGSCDSEQISRWFAVAGAFLSGLQAVLARLAENDIYLPDLSPGNVLVVDGKPVLIDLEELSSVEGRGVRDGVHIHTPGFDIPAVVRDVDIPAFQVGLFAAYILTFGLASQYIEDFGRIEPLVCGMVNRFPEAEHIAARAQIVFRYAQEAIQEEKLQSVFVDRLPGIERCRKVNLLAESILDYGSSVTPTWDEGSLWPPNFMSVKAGTLSLLDGDTGVIYALKMCGLTESKFLESWKRRCYDSLASGSVPGGLHYGSAGIALTAALVGESSLAEDALEYSFNWWSVRSPSPCLGTGAGGVAIVASCLGRMGIPFNHDIDRIIDNFTTQSREMKWRSGGLVRGQLGVALAQLSLAVARNDDALLTRATDSFRDSLSFVVSSPWNTLGARDDLESKIFDMYLYSGLSGYALVAKAFSDFVSEKQCPEVFDFLRRLDYRNLVLQGSGSPSLYRGISGALTTCAQVFSDQAHECESHFRSIIDSYISLPDRRALVLHPILGTLDFSLDSGAAGVALADHAFRENVAITSLLPDFCLLYGRG